MATMINCSGTYVRASLIRMIEVDDNFVRIHVDGDSTITLSYGDKEPAHRAAAEIAAACEPYRRRGK